jgi:hypothetical protein
MVTSFQAFAVFLIALLPGATYAFSYERMAGSFGVTGSDRVIRFVAASAAFQALFAGLTFDVYQHYIVDGGFVKYGVNPGLVELVALLYVLVPAVAGTLIGFGQLRSSRVWRWATLLSTAAPEPRAWDHVWRHTRSAVIRLKLKSGGWLAGAYGTVDGRRAYASAYPESGDLFLSVGFQIDPTTGEFARDTAGSPILSGGGLLIRWDEVEYLEVVES